MPRITLQIHVVVRCKPLPWCLEAACICLKNMQAVVLADDIGFSLVRADADADGAGDRLSDR